MAASRPFGQLEVTPLDRHAKKGTISRLRHIEADVAGKAFNGSVLIISGALSSQRKEMEELEKAKRRNSSNVNLGGRIKAPS